MFDLRLISSLHNYKFFTMKKLQLNKTFLLGSVFFILALTALSFRDSNTVNKKTQQVYIDTLPKKTTIEVEINKQDVQEIIKQSMEAVNKSLKEINWIQISKEVEQALKEIDVEKIKNEIKTSLASIDVQKIKNDVNKSLKEIDKEKMKAEIQKTVREALENINTEELKKDLENLKIEIDIHKYNEKKEVKN
jgi:hypothetical protein